MSESHPSAEDFEGFLRSSSPPAHRRNGQVLRHLLMECRVCRERLREMGWSPQRLARLLRPAAERERPWEETAATSGYDYSGAFAVAERSLSAFLAREEPFGETSVEPLLAELDILESQEQAQYVDRDGRFAAPAVVRALIDRSHAVRYRSSDQMLQQANLARLCAEACGTGPAGGELRLADLRARAWGQYGNALRVNSRPREAEGAFATAQSYRESGTGDPVLRAWLIEKIVPLVIFQGRFEPAIALCDEAGEIYREIGQSHLLASTMVQKAIACVYGGEEAGAIRILNQAIPLIDYEEDPHLLLAACHNLIRCYIDLGRPEQALEIYSEVRELYQEFDDSLILLRAAWQEGQLLRDLGHLRAAEAALLRSRKGYMERELAYEVALVSLDLATVYVKLGLVKEVQETAASTVPIFRSLRVELETLAALLHLQQVADQEQQALELIRSLTARIQPLSRKPGEGR
ncbi:MAG TPA: tetratricopeptide repeat protein [Thermoanaerobaculia bacterium]|nr:tetratricopeptide repeat protein [Thermoanaerobaculia bacterium]